MAKAVKLADIAEQVGVSTVTVSKSFVRTKRCQRGNAGENKESCRRTWIPQSFRDETAVCGKTI